LLTGKTPFSGTSATEVLKAHVMDPLPAINDINPDVPEDVVALVERLFAKKPDDRYQTAAEVVAEITRLQQGLGLGTERIGGGETMLLRRYVSGEKGGQQTPAHTTNTRTPRVADGGATTAERTLRGDRGNNALIKGGVIFTTVLILFLIGWIVIGSGRHGTQLTTQNIPPPQDPINIPIPIVPTPDNNDRPHTTALTSLEERLRNGGEQLDLNAMRAQVEELRAQRLSNENRIRAKQLLDRIGELLNQRHVKAVEQDFSTLRTEVQKLVNEYNFELALQRLNAFPAKDDPLVSAKVTALTDDVTRAKSSYLTSLRLKMQNAINQKQIAKLKELRDQLPAPLLGTAAETDITAAIQGIEAEQQSAQQAIVSQAALELSRWNFSALETLATRSRPSMGTTENGKQFDLYYEASKQLTAMVKAMGTQLSASTRHPRYRGILKGWTDPDLMSADMSGLQIEIASGGSAGLKWSELPNDALQNIVKLVLVNGAADQYLPALSVLVTAQSQGASGQ
jgi:hypothetical protein